MSWSADKTLLKNVEVFSGLKPQGSNVISNWVDISNWTLNIICICQADAAITERTLASHRPRTTSSESNVTTNSGALSTPRTACSEIRARVWESTLTSTTIASPAVSFFRTLKFKWIYIGKWEKEEKRFQLRGSGYTWTKYVLLDVYSIKSKIWRNQDYGAQYVSKSGLKSCSNSYRDYCP